MEPDLRPLPLLWTKRASASVETLADYIARDRPQAAQHMLETIAHAVQLLASRPAIGQPGRVPGTRELVISGTPYIVVYRVRAGSLRILHVLHGARKWPQKF